MGTPAIPLIISLIAALIVTGGWRWGGMLRWLLMAVLGPGAFAGSLLWWLCSQSPRACSIRCLLNASQDEACLVSAPAVPTVTAINPLDANPTNQDTVRYEVQFSQDVTGVDLADFNLDPTLTNAGVAQVQGSGRTYTVSVNTGTGTGPLQLNLVDDDSIRTSGGTPLGGEGVGNGNFSGVPYTVERSVDPPVPVQPPLVTAISRLDANPTDQPRVRYEVQFDQAVTGVDSADFQLNTTGVIGARVIETQGSGTTYRVLVTTGTGDGTLQLDLIDDDSIVNRDGTPLGGQGAGNGNFSGPRYQVEPEPPIPGLW